MTRVAKDNKSHTVRCVVTLSRYEVSQWLDPHHIDAVNTIRWRVSYARAVRVVFGVVLTASFSSMKVLQIKDVSHVA
jgi:hypothetical protein